MGRKTRYVRSHADLDAERIAMLCDERKKLLAMRLAFEGETSRTLDQDHWHISTSTIGLHRIRAEIILLPTRWRYARLFKRFQGIL